MFWDNRNQLLSLERDELEDGMSAIMRDRSLTTGVDRLHLSDQAKRDEATTPRPLVAIPYSGSRLAVDLGQPVISHASWASTSSSPITIWVVEVVKASAHPATIYSHPVNSDRPTSLGLALPSPKADSWAYKSALAKFITTLKPLLEDSHTSLIIRPGTEAHLDLLASPPKDTDIDSALASQPGPSDLVASRKTALPVVLLLLCSFPSLSGSPVIKLDKQAISSVLLSLVAFWPDGSPPRAALKRVNEILLGSTNA